MPTPLRPARPSGVLALLAVLAALAGCGRDEPAPEAAAPAATDGAFGEFKFKSLSFRGGAVEIAGTGPNARISGDGTLTIDGQPVPVSDAQRRNLVAYHRTANSLRANGIATGRAGVDVAKTAVTEVISGLAKGDTAGIEKSVEAKAETVKAAALKLCDDVATLRALQDDIAAEVEAFRPYAFIGILDVADCRKDVDGGTTADASGAALPPGHVPIGTDAAPAPAAGTGAAAAGADAAKSESGKAW